MTDCKPTSATRELSFLDVFQLDEIQKLQDAFSASTGVASLITDPNGNPITNPSNFCSLCHDIIRRTEIGLRNCKLSDTILGQPDPAGPIISHCLSGGLCDAGVSIYFGDRHVANWLIGQVIIDDAQARKVMDYASIINANREDFAKALAEVPRMSSEHFQSICSFLYITASYISRDALLKVVQRHEIEERQRIEIELLTEKANLAKAHAALGNAYENTIEGWALALELRDIESAGHSRRVAELTVRIAKRMGISGEDLHALRRGAVLHDIGKMSIPDSILLKPGTLNEREWKVMKQHPVHAERLLRPIPFLHSALDIPLFHHEKWNGTGYPKGLKKTEIPLSARIFSIVDVYDALSSDRPYRTAWPQEKVLDHLLTESEVHFDPDVVSAFMAVIHN